MDYADLVSFRMEQRLIHYEQRRAELEAGIEFCRFKYRVVRDVEERAAWLVYVTKGNVERRATIDFKRWRDGLREHRLTAYSDGRRLIRELDVLDAQAAEAREWLGMVELEAL